MNILKEIKATESVKPNKEIFPQIYAYIIHDYLPHEGWIKIGYTDRESVETRIKEQTHTAAFRFVHETLWAEPAKYPDSEIYFKDHQFHAFLTKFKQRQREQGSEWFYYNGNPDFARQDFHDFINGDYRQKDQSGMEYTLRAEQQQAVEKTLHFANANPNSEFLWNAKPRFGKTLTTYDFALKLNAKNVLIVTNRPAIANSWFDDFNKFIAWQSDFAFVSTADSIGAKTLNRDEFLAQRATGKKNLLAFLSLQDLKGSQFFGGKYDKLQWVKDTQWDLLVIDEAHEGVDTLKTDLAFDNIQRRFTLHLSGTPFKALAKGGFSEDEIYNWSYADEQQAKANWDNPHQNNPYENLPKLNMFSYQMSRMIADTVNQGAEIDGENHDFAFDLNEFFATNENGKFIHEKEVKKWLETLTRNEKYPFSTPELRNELKHTFWLLDRVASAKALQKLLKSTFGFEQYEIVLAAGDGKNDDSDAKENIKSLDKVRQAIKSGKNTITLSVGQLTTGVTVPEWTAVLMLSNLKSPALYMQAAFRAQNPWSYSENGKHFRKENAYLFDFAPERTLTIYDEFANNLAHRTANGGGTSGERSENIKTLLNFFPVIAEDDQGRMVELDAQAVLTIPKAIKAAEVVRRGFMSNLLFDNIGGIFAGANDEVKAILAQLPIAKDDGKLAQGDEIDTDQVNLDENGNVPAEWVISESQARFGEKLYQSIAQAVEEAAEETAEEAAEETADTTSDLASSVADTFKAETETAIKTLASEQGISAKAAQRIVEQQTQAMKTAVEKASKQAGIARIEAEKAYQQAVEKAENAAKVAELQAQYQVQQQQLEATLKQKLAETVQTATAELAENATREVLQQAQEAKKAEVESDIRDHLRGFSRTIPMFLMAYGSPNTTLANFDEIVPDHIFQEVTGISLAQFRILRDDYHFFDEQVFNESVKEFMQKRTALADYFDESQTEDIFSYIPPQKTSQIFTPRAVVQMMLDKLEQEDPEIFTDPNRTFADLYVKSGLFLTEIVKRLYQGLICKIPDKNDRLQHILQHQIYGFAPSKIIHRIADNFVFGFDDTARQIQAKNLICFDTTAIAKDASGQKSEEICKILTGNEKMKFDVVVGNPPYQDETVGDSTSNAPIYPYFYDLAEKCGQKYCLITPARFLFNAGATDKKWNEKMLNDPHLSVKFFEQVSANVFPKTDIPGGVAVLYRDEKKACGKIGTFTSFQELNGILHKVAEKTDETLDSIISGRGIYRLTPKAHEDFPEIETLQSKGHMNDVGTNILTMLQNIVFFQEKPNDGYEYVQVLGRYQNQRAFHFIRRDYLNAPENFENFKVILPKANGSGAIGEVLSTPLIGTSLIGTPLIGFTETFISIGSFNNLLEAENCLKYVKSKFARTMLGVLKITQDNTRDKWAKVPMQDFTANSDIDWTQPIPAIDRQLYQKYGLAENEIAFIEEKVREME